MHTLLGPRLSIMMFLQFFIWGSWYVTGPGYLAQIGFTPGDIGWTYTVGPLAGILSPFFVGMIGDRFFPTERILGVMHLLGAAAMLLAMQLMGQTNPSPNTINICFFLHMLCYYPTLSLTNTLGLSNLDNAEKQFPLIRVFGTIGWIAAGFAVDLLGWTTAREMFYLPVLSGVLLGVYSFTLPHTPPPLAGQPTSIAQIAGADAFALFKKPSFLVFMLCSFLICIPLAFYYQMAARCVQQTGVENVGMTMSLGQFFEVPLMLLIPVLIPRIGIKGMLIVGMGSWVVRYGLFAVGAPQPNPVMWMMLTGIILHGICYDFFFVTGQIYTDKVAPNAIRGQAQGMLVLFTLGVGMLIGAQVAGYIEAKFTPQSAVELDKQAKELGDEVKQVEKQLEAQLAELSDEQKAVYDDWKNEKEFATQPLPDGEARIAAEYAVKIHQLQLNQDEATLSALKEKDWKMIWLIPAAAAAVVLVVFTLFFRDDSDKATSLAGEFAANTTEDGTGHTA